MLISNKYTTYKSLISIKVTSFNFIEPCVYPVQELLLVVYGQPIGGTDISLDNKHSTIAAEEGSLDPRLAAVPVGPEHTPTQGKNQDLLFTGKLIV